MTDRGIIFSAPMVLALLAGRKLQTRRLYTSPLRRCERGDRLWVRETFRHWQGSASRKTACYVADGTWLDHGSGWTGKPEGITWCSRATPSIHMPRWASRLTLIVEKRRFQPLQAITDEDAIAEGCVWDEGKAAFWVPGVDHPNKDFPYLARPTAREMYAALWDTLHGSGDWLSNPEVVALTFRVELANIDQLAEAA
jgi:hypothetical protein